MSAQLWETATSNAFSTSLNGSITDSDTTITLTSVTGLVAPGILCIDRVDANNTATPVIREYVSFTGISGQQITGVTRGVAGSTAQSHSSGAVVEENFSVTHYGDLKDFLEVEHDTDGTHTSAVVTTLKATGTEVNTGTEDAKIVTPKAIADSTVTTTTKTQTLSNKTIVQRVASYAPSGAGTTTLDLSTGGVHSVTMPAATQTLAISNATTGQCFIVEINNVTSQGALTWFTTIRWAGGSEPTLTGTNGKRDTFGFRVTGTGTYDGFIVGQNI